MKRFSLLSVSLACLLVLLSTERAPAQAAPPPATERAPIAGRTLTLDECIAIALEAQPRIQATLSDYAAARYRVNQALSPLLPQLSGLVSATRSQSNLTVTSQTTGQTLQIPSSRQLSDTFLAQVLLSQLLFDFGKNLAATEAARKLAEVAVGDVGAPRPLLSLPGKEAYPNNLVAGRLIRGQGQAGLRARLKPPAGDGVF